MKKSTAQIIVIAVVALILLNVTLIGLLWTKKKSTPSRPGPKPIEEINVFMIKELGFDEEQATVFIKISREHRSAQKQNHEEFRRRKFDINQKMLAGEQFDYDSAAIRLSEVTINKEREFYRFFVQVFEICNEDQKKKLQKVFFEATGPPEHGKMPFQ